MNRRRLRHAGTEGFGTLEGDPVVGHEGTSFGAHRDDRDGEQLVVRSPTRPVELVPRLSHAMTLEPGEVILCGTSLGVVPMKPGTTVEVEIGGIGPRSKRLRHAGGSLTRAVAPQSGCTSRRPRCAASVRASSEAAA